MANFTERAIEESFIKLLGEQPLNKITVRQIVADCGISRNTFYYHFHDVYDVLLRLFEEEERKLISDVESSTSLRQSMAAALRFAFANKTAIYHIYNSINHDALTQYLYTAADICMRSYIVSQAQGLDVSQEDLDNLIYLYSSMLEGAIINLLREGIPADADPFIEKSIRQLEGTVRLALENSVRKVSLV